MMQAMTSVEPTKGFLLIFGLMAVGLLTWAIVASSKSRGGRWVLGIFGGLILIFICFCGIFFARSSLSRVAEPATVQIQTGNDFQAWQRTQIIGAPPVPWPGSPPSPAPPAFPGGLRPPQAPERQHPPVSPAPAPPPRGWVETNGGSQRVAQSIGGLNVEVYTPGPNGELVGYSASLEPTPEEALKAARASLAQKLKGLVKLEIARSFQEPLDKPLEAIVDALVAKYLEQPNVEVDRYEQPVQLPTTRDTVHRAAVMTVLPKDQVPRIAAQATQISETVKARTAEARQTWAWTVATALLLGLFIYIVYSFLNAGTKGHLAWPLRLVSITAFLILAAVLLVLRGHLS